MSNVVELFARTADADVRYTPIWTGEKGDQGQHIVLAKEEWLKSGNEGYAVLYIAPEGCVDGFDILKHFQTTPEGLSLAQFAAEVADRALASFIMYQPDDAEAAE